MLVGGGVDQNPSHWRGGVGSCSWGCPVPAELSSSLHKGLDGEELTQVLHGPQFQNQGDQGWGRGSGELGPQPVDISCEPLATRAQVLPS